MPMGLVRGSWATYSESAAFEDKLTADGGLERASGGTSSGAEARYSTTYPTTTHRGTTNH